MAKISTYANASPVALSDLLIGTSVGATPANATKNFLVSDLIALFEGNVTLQDVLDAGNTATQDIVLTGSISLTGDLTIGAGIIDSNASLGTVGQVLTSNGTIAYWDSSPSIYGGSGTVPVGTVATISSDLTWTGGGIKRVTNSRNFIEVTQESDMPSSLQANTTYIIRGRVNFTTPRTVTSAGCEVIGLDRNEDTIQWGGAGALFTVTDVNFSMDSVKLTSTEAGNSILSATNVDGVSYNDGRDAIISIRNCQFRGTFDVMDIKGFDLVDINNSLFFYIKAQNFGLRFQDVSKLQITSCEMIRWFDESTLPTPSGYATVPMIELQANNLSSFGAVNINGCIIHPQDVQKGIDISTSSTTGFGTISSNAFVNVGLTNLADIFVPNAGGAPDYSQTATYNYDAHANQGITNSNAYVLTTLSGANTTPTAFVAVNTPTQVLLGGLAVATNSQRWSVAADGTMTYNGTKPIYVEISASVSFQKGSGGGTDDYTFYIDKGGILQTASATLTTGSSSVDTTTVIYSLTAVNGTALQLWAENNSGTVDLLVTGVHILVKE